MPYRFAIHDQDYSDYSAGRVFYSQPGSPAFPVRLASEIFQRALELQKAAAPLTVYDPTCGGAYHLAALGFLHGEMIQSIVASDADPGASALAQRNLSLLSAAGLDRREREIQRMFDEYGKESHAAALRSLASLRERLSATAPIATSVFVANAFYHEALQSNLAGISPDLVFSDVPYGSMTSWQVPFNTTGRSQPAVWLMLDSLRVVLSARALVAVAADKNQRIVHEVYQRVEHFQVGKRQVVFLRLAERGS